MQPEAGAHLYDQFHVFAGPDEARLADMQAAFDDPGVRAVLCARGGYGTTRWLDRLDWRGFRAAPKWLVGYSDATALLLAAQAQGFQALHATMPLRFGDAGATPALDSLHSHLFTGTDICYAPAHPLNRPGRAVAPLVGGNLALLVSSLGTATAPTTRGCWLFIEEVGEYLYRLDRMMGQLRRAGLLAELTGLLVGQCTDMLDNPAPDMFGQTAEEIIAAAVADYDFPVAFGLPIGHIAGHVALPVGGQGDVVVDAYRTRLTSTAFPNT